MKKKIFENKKAKGYLKGINKFNESHPDVRLVTGSIDRQLNEKGYILPGLGDAGDRIYGT